MPRPHVYAWDLRRIVNPRQRSICWSALAACDYPFKRIRRNTGSRVPCSVSELDRFEADMTKNAHVHVHNEKGEHGHLLGEPTRRAPLGLYWLPTSEFPAGRVELDHGIFAYPDLAREVFLSEAAHAVDFGVPLTEEQRRAIFAILHGGDPSRHEDHGWWDEHGSDDYWSFAGESFMGLFMGAFAPSLPRPLQARQPWKHPVTADMYPKVRAVLL